MIISVQNYPRCIWHTDCEVDTHHSGIMKVVRHDEKSSLMECLHCGKKGHYPVGSWYVCQEYHEVAGDFSEYEDDDDED